MLPIEAVPLLRVTLILTEIKTINENKEQVQLDVVV